MEWLGTTQKFPETRVTGKLKMDSRVRCYWVPKSTSVVRSSQPLVYALFCTVFGTVSHLVVNCPFEFLLIKLFITSNKLSNFTL